MSRRGVEIHYGDVAPEAKENFVPISSEQENFVTLGELQQYNLEFQNYINLCELNLMVLNGDGQPFPDAPENENMGLWSVQLSQDDGTFEIPIVLTLTAGAQYSSQGLTLTFDTQNNIFANHINIKWYRNEEVIDDKNFEPNTAKYYCQNKVFNYDKVVITFYSLNMPRNRLKFRAIDYGYGTIFYGGELRNVNLIQQIDPLSSELAINTVDFTLDSHTDIEYSFQAKQTLSTYFNGELKATTFVKSSKRQAKKLWNVQSEDYIGLLDSIPFAGGMFVGENAKGILTTIFEGAKIPVEIDDALSDETLTGYIPFSTCRDAILQIAFAIRAIVDTSNSAVVRIYRLNDEVTQTVPLNRIMQGQNFDSEEKVTSVELSAHIYTPIAETLKAYDATESGVGENIFIKFSAPLHDLVIEKGEIIASGTNYAVINANEGCLLTGQKYEHSTFIKRKTNPLVQANEIEKNVTVNSCTLVNKNNVDILLEKCYNYIVSTEKVNCKIVEGKHVQYGAVIKYGQKKYGTFKYGEKAQSVITYDKPVNVGDIITAETEYLGDVTGRAIKQTFNLNGGIIIKDTVISRQGA